MNNPDLVNALFELCGAIVVWISVWKLYQEKEIKGVYWPAWAFFAAWGIWNLFYYPSLDQVLSFYAGIVLVLGNVTWTMMAVYYTYRVRTFHG